MNYAAGIAKARRLAGLSQGALARKIGVTPGCISRLEAGTRKPSVDMLDKIARACGAMGLEVFEWSQEPKKTPPTAWEAIEAQEKRKALAKKSRRETRS